MMAQDKIEFANFRDPAMGASIVDSPSQLGCKRGVRMGGYTGLKPAAAYGDFRDYGVDAVRGSPGHEPDDET